MAEQWQNIASRKQQERASRIPSGWLLPFSYSAEAGAENVLDVPRSSGILSERELYITESLDATALTAEIAQGRLKSVDVVVAFCKRAAIAQQLTNCLTEIFFDDGIARAKELDDILRRTGTPVGPLHGLPISVKDTFNVKGYDSSLGVGALCFKPAACNSVLIDILLSQGAVLYCKTGVPQTLAALDSHNNIFGRVLNPANRLLTAGGSTGGEGALLAMRGSPLGVGTDIGGSIRVPAMCNGLVGVKPSHGRVPYARQRVVPLPGSGKLGIESVAGPLAHSVRDAELFMKVVSANALSSRDSEVVPQTWDLQQSLRSVPTFPALPRPLRVGIARWDGHVRPLPPIANMIEDVARKLRAPTSPGWNAVEVVDVEVERIMSQCVKTFNGIMSIDGSNTWMDVLAETGEPLSPWLESRMRRKAPKSADEVRLLQAHKAALQTQFLDVWREEGGYWRTDASRARTGDRVINVLICPVAPHPTPLIDQWNSTNYTSAFNLLDLSAGVLPVRPVLEHDLVGEVPGDRAVNGWDAINRKMWTEVDRRNYLGSMMCLQIVAPRLADRRLVEAMLILENALSSLRNGDHATSKL